MSGERLDVLRLGYRLGRDPRITTHLALVSRALGADRFLLAGDEDPKMFEREFLKYLEENNIELDDTIAEEVTLDNGKLSKGIYVLTQDVVTTEDEEEIDALEGDEVEAFEDTPAADTILGVDVFPVIHTRTKQKIFVSAEDIKEVDIGDLL